MYRHRFRSAFPDTAGRRQVALAATAATGTPLEKFATRFAEASLLAGVVCLVGLALTMTLIGTFH